MVDFCVDFMSVDDGYIINIIKYVFDIDSVICDFIGIVFKYYKSSYYFGIDFIDILKYGYIENKYFNGLID